jgi:biotin carboxyl carrier protein
MDATVVATPVVAGQVVESGELLAVLEAMKMELEVRASRAGTVAELLVAEGDAVTAGQPLVTLS